LGISSTGSFGSVDPAASPSSNPFALQNVNQIAKTVRIFTTLFIQAMTLDSFWCVDGTDRTFELKAPDETAASMAHTLKPQRRGNKK
jgi:hypothetical protein